MGLLPAEDIKQRMLAAHVSVVSSSAENSPNTLGEAMMLGVPSVAAYAGGMPSMAEDGREVLFYLLSLFSCPSLLAETKLGQ